jgi:hypothetical protein
MSISSTLIHACLTNVKKEFSQLEHWLNSLHSEAPNQSNLEGSMRALVASVENLTKQYESQQLALHHIADRLEILERGKEAVDPWLDSASTCLENTIIDPLESVYVVHKEDELPVIEDKSDVAVNKTVVEEKPVVVEKKPVVIEEKPVVVEKKPVVIEEKPVVIEEKPVVAEEESVVEEDEEGGLELEEITYKDVSYYKDTEGFVYGIDDEGQPTEQPIGVWKEKSQSVSFYRLK